MGIAVFSRSPVFSVLLSPLQALASFLRPTPSTHPVPDFMKASRHPGAAETQLDAKKPVPGTRPLNTMGKKPCHTVAKAASSRRLKVVREFEAGISSSCAGRMVISGRMADVCAELDRMAQRETAQAI
ncbi:hypothetical protein [Polaromonas sp. A23]|uniref:hypothetical protein n=1 Tax=Polaromonas sp. A23 TaxID=1944133 RepID=UPI00098437B6|nr:hypothetical protein [Polaromonas sp. A23]OOG39783.1 hypothetical protein B0B52_14230 [Polaromonas sp. A23]